MAEIIRILIADDFQLLREDMSELINRQPDMEVVGMAASGKDIVALAKQIPYDLILMDIEMEQKNAGIQATEIIRQDKPDAQIIFLSVHETKDIVVTAMGAGAIDYLVKGCPEEEILHHIRCAI